MGDCCCSYTQNIASHVYVIIGTIHLKKKTRLTKARNEWLGGQLFSDEWIVPMVTYI